MYTATHTGEAVFERSSKVRGELMRSLGALLLISFVLTACGDQEQTAPSQPSDSPELEAASPVANETPSLPPSSASTPTPSAPLTTATAVVFHSPTEEPSPTATPPSSPTPIPPSVATSTTFLPTSTVDRGSAVAPGPRLLPTTMIPFLMPTPITQEMLPGVLDQIGSQVSRVRELTSLRTIERDFISRQNLGQRLREDLEEGREELALTQQIYIVLGVMEEGIDLYDLLLGLYGEAVLGFYTAEEEKFFVVQESARFGPPEQRTYAHEFVHGLQQQHFDIHAIRGSLEGNSDAGSAFTALVEGDASLGELLYSMENMSRSQRLASIPAPSSDLLDVFRSAPHVVQRSLLFPYVEGQAFVESLFLRNRWVTVNRAYEVLPQSTEQILHPQKYFDMDNPQTVVPPDLFETLGEGWVELDKDNMGEFFLRTYLEGDIGRGQAARAAAGWGGDSYTFLIGPAEQQLLVSSIVWDTPEDAEEFHDAFVVFTESRGGELEESPDGFASTTLMIRREQVILVETESKATLLVFAPDRATLETVKEGIAQSRSN